MSDFIKLVKQERTGSLKWLNSTYQEALANIQAQTLPTRKTESWKYTSLRALEKGDYTAEPAHLAESEIQQVLQSVSRNIEIDNLNTYNFIFVNGMFVESASVKFSELVQQGIECTLFSRASESEQTKIKSVLAKKIDNKKHYFASINAMLVNDGIYICARKNSVCDKPIRVIHINTAQENNYSSYARLVVELEQSANLNVIEQFVTPDESVNAFVNAVSEFIVGDNAALTHYRLNEEQEDLVHIGALHFELNKHSTLDSFHLALGGKIKRVDIDTHCVAQGVDSKINGVYLPKNNQHIDFHTCTEHTVPHCTSSENFRGIIADNAQAVFNGRIHIHPDAQKTLAELSNKNLLLSDKAQIFTKPELEIYADDVKCAHGATVAQLNEQSMYYLVSRGISKEEAKVMLSFGFINELLNELSNDALANYLRPLLTTVFSNKPELLRHLS